ncbi:hypothetical protein AAHE18_14G196800 [Arachis hypogaea]
METGLRFRHNAIINTHELTCLCSLLHSLFQFEFCISVTCIVDPNCLTAISERIVLEPTSLLGVFFTVFFFHYLNLAFYHSNSKFQQLASSSSNTKSLYFRIALSHYS